MASKTNACHLKHLNCDYIKKLHKPEDEAISAIADLIEDLHEDKDLTVDYIIKQADAEQLISRLFHLLKTSQSIVVGNTAFILGTLAEFEDGRSKILKILKLEDSNKLNSMNLLISLLDVCDPETLLNVTGTIGSLVESSEGRNFVLSRNSYFSNLVSKVNNLLSSADLWIASNAALIIARISIDEIGNSYLFNCPLLDRILINLIEGLTIDNAGRGMNAAFALGRIFDNESALTTYYSLIYKMKFIERLINMTNCSEMAFVKNSCFCLSSIMGSKKGFEMVITHSSVKHLIFNLENLLSQNDEEAIWFGVLTLKIISKKPSGCKLLRKTSDVLKNIKACLENRVLSEEVRNESQEIINNLTPLQTPLKPNVNLVSPYEVYVTWKYFEVKNDFEVKTFLYYKQDDDEMLAYRGKKSEVTVRNLEPNKKYEFFLKFSNDIEMTEPSESCIVVTAEDYPSEPLNLRVITSTATQIKLGWDEPEKVNGSIKHYIIYMKQCKKTWMKMIRKYFPHAKVGLKDKRNYEQTLERTSIISGLQPETRYTFSVCAVNACGKGAAVEIEATTLNSGAHAPDRPNVSILGRSEANLTWNPPEAPMGKIFRYDVKLNQKAIVHSGIQTYCKISNLKSDTEYSFSVVVVTSEGRYESPICRKRTARDEYTGSNRAPLYEAKVKFGSGDGPVSQKTPCNTNLQNNPSKYQKKILNNAEIDSNTKSVPNRQSAPLIRFPIKNFINTDFLKSNTSVGKSSTTEPVNKLQPILPSQVKSKTVASATISIDSFTNSLSIPSLSSASIDIPSSNSKKSSETYVTNIRSRDSNDRSGDGSKQSSENDEFMNREKLNFMNRSHFRKVSIKNGNEMATIPDKGSMSKIKDFHSQRRTSKVFR